MTLDISIHARQWAASQSASTHKVETTGLLVVFGGNGKGKSTAAFGMAQRALLHNLRVGVVRFLSGPELSSDARALGKHALCDVKEFGGGCSWDATRRIADKGEVAAGWREAKRMLDDPTYKMVILDDLSWIIHHGYLDIDTVSRALRARRRDAHVVLAGRYMPHEWMDMADMATEMRQVSHPYPNKAIAPQAGVDF